MPSRGLALFVFCCAGAAVAQPAPDDALRFQYVAPEECPGVEAFTARVRERTERVRLAEEGELARTFAVTLKAEAGGFSGAVEFLDDAGSAVSRRVRGEQCDEVVSGLALITALALEARLEPEPEPAAPAAPPPPPVDPPPPPPPKPAPTTRWERDTGQGPSARVGVSGGYGSLLDAFSLGLLGQLDWPRGSSLLGALRLRGHFAESEREVSGRFAKLRLLGLEASACPQGLWLEPFVAYGCLAFDVGSLRASGVEGPELPFPDSSIVAWLAVGAELRVAWQPDAPFWLELNGQLGTPVVKHLSLIHI